MYCNSKLDDHDWRLFSRTETYIVSEIKNDKGIVVGGNSFPSGQYKELWYCTKCRFIEERVVT